MLYGLVLSLVIGGGGQSKARRHQFLVEVLFYEELFGLFLLSIIERRGTEKKKIKKIKKKKKKKKKKEKKKDSGHESCRGCVRK